MEKNSQRQIGTPTFIRQQLLRLSREQFAKALRLELAAVTKWEQRGTIPAQHRPAIEKLAERNGVTIKHSWWTQVPWARGVPR